MSNLAYFYVRGRSLTNVLMGEGVIFDQVLQAMQLKKNMGFLWHRGEGGSKNTKIYVT